MNNIKEILVTQNSLCRTCMSPAVDINIIPLYSLINILQKEQQLDNLLELCTSIQVIWDSFINRKPFTYFRILDIKK